MLKDQKELLERFNANGVRYLVVGGHAVGIHAEPRGTNSVAVFRALTEFGAPIAGMSPDDFNDKPTSVFQMGVPPSRIDILQSIEGVIFDEAWPRRVDEILAGQVLAHVLSRDDLIKNKLAVGRLQDLADVEKIREAAEAKERK